MLAAGVADDQIAELDGDWSKLPEAERAEFEFTKKLAHAPNTVTEADLDAIGKHYKPLQVLEIAVSVAGFASTNRWTSSLNIPAEESGDFFRKKDSKEDFSTFKTPTSDKYKSAVTSLAFIKPKATTSCPPAVPVRPELESREQVEAAWKSAAERKASLPMADVEGANWEKLLSSFPKANAGRMASIKAGMTKGKLSAKLKAELAWVAARHDRAWYALAIAKKRLADAGLSTDEIFALDAEKNALPEAEKLAVAFAKKLTVAPQTITDGDIAGLRKHFKDAEVAEIVHHLGNAAFFDRVTEVARLPLDK